jgi:uncharacterized protein
MTGTSGSFVWYELTSTDVPAAKAFYGKLVGWTLQDVPMPGMTYAIMRAGESQVGGMMAMPREARVAGMKPFWAPYIEVTDVDAAAAKLERLRGRIHRPPQDIPNVGRFAVVADPQGALFNLFKPLQSGQRSISNAPGQIGWHELHAKDWRAAFEFYGEMFGWGEGDNVDMGAMGAYQLFTIQGIPSGGMFNSPVSSAPCHWLIYFSVDGIDAAAKCITDSGGKIEMGPHQVPGGGWIVGGSDPQGAAFALTSRRK